MHINVNHSHHVNHLNHSHRGHVHQHVQTHLHTHSAPRLVAHVNASGHVHTVAVAGPTISLLVNVLA